MTPQRKGAGKKTHTHSHSLFVSGSCVCVCVCVCVCPQNHCLGGLSSYNPQSIYLFPERKTPCLCVCLSLSLTHTERRELCVRVAISRKSLSELSRLLASRKKDVLFPQRKKILPTHTHTHTHTQKCDSPLCLYYLENEQTNKQTFCFSAHRKLYVCLSLGKKNVSIPTLKSHFLKNHWAEIHPPP